jgi:hypothetical protein
MDIVDDAFRSMILVAVLQMTKEPDLLILVLLLLRLDLLSALVFVTLVRHIDPDVPCEIQSLD